MRGRFAALAVVLVAAVAGLGLSAWLGSGAGGSDAPDAGPGDAGDVGALSAAAPAARGATAFDPAAAASAPGRGVAIVARGRRAAVAVHRRPGGPTTRTVARRTVEGRRLPAIFRVLERRGGWLRVELPVRPNRARGWVRAADVTLARSDYRIVIARRAHRLTLLEDGRVVLRAPIAVGRAVSPTPTGSYFVTDLLRPPDPRGFYGPYALGLSAYSPVYTSFAGGDGQVGIHGTDAPAALGSDVSHGCIRVANATITRLAERVPLGTPVTIRG